jgi:hypothetical protein
MKNLVLGNVFAPSAPFGGKSTAAFRFKETLL